MDVQLSPEQKKSISMRLGIDLMGAGILLVGLFWNWFYPDQILVGSSIQAVAALLVGSSTLYRGIRDLFQSNPLQYSDQLVALAVLASAATGDFITATLVPLALDIGRIFEERTALGAKTAIRNIRALQAEKATRILNDKEELVLVSELQVGDVLLIRAGERIAADGVVISGDSYIDQSAMTGESKPEHVQIDSKVYAGTSNIDGILQVCVSGLGKESAIGRIISLLVDAEVGKMPIVRRVETWLAMYMPVALVLSASVLFVTEELDRAITILIVAFPTSLVLAGPATMVAAFSRASKLSFLIKDPAFFQLLYQADHVVFDKTGTLTSLGQSTGSIQPYNSYSGEQVLEVAALCAKASLHPISQTITAMAKKQGIIVPRLDAQEVSGQGVKVENEGVVYRLGRRAWLQDNGVEILVEETGVGSWVSKDNELLGFVSVEDPIRKDAFNVVKQFKDAGFVEVTLLTGDRLSEANRVANSIGIEQVYAEKLPEEKLKVVKDIRDSGHIVLMVGDGINDALALQEADVGIAIGTSLNRAAAGGADAALLSSNLQSLVKILDLTDSVHKIILQNLVLGVLFAVLMMGLASMGMISPLLAAIFHNFGALLVIANSSRLLVEENPMEEEFVEGSNLATTADG
jgi:Zn2+/Cd2+-exporting ATPase